MARVFIEEVIDEIGGNRAVASVDCGEYIDYFICPLEKAIAKGWILNGIADDFDFRKSDDWDWASSRTTYYGNCMAYQRGEVDENFDGRL